jgi:signal transduction histidine kinase
MTHSPKHFYSFRDLWFARSGSGMSYAVIGLAAGLCVATGALVWFGYVATREWKRGTDQLLERRQAEGMALAAAALDRDMTGLSTLLLLSPNPSMFEQDPPYDFARITAGAFARFPYAESALIWKQGANGTTTSFVLTRAERHPSWDYSDETDDSYPVRLHHTPSSLDDLISRIRSGHQSGRSFAADHITVDGTPYQVVIRYLLPLDPPFSLSAFVAFLVNLNWVRSEYFQPVLHQTQTIGGTAGILAFAVRDDHGDTVAITGPMRPDAPTLRRSFPFLFIDPTLLRVPRAKTARYPLWSVEVAFTTHDTDSSASEATRRTFTLIALSAIVSIGALFVTLRAVEAKAALATMKSDFVSAVTHELKTPVAVIRLVGDTLSRARYSAADVEEYAKVLSNETTKLTQAIDQLLTYARYSDAQKIDSARMSILNVAELVETSVESLRPTLDAAQADVTVDVPHDLPSITVDRMAVNHVFENVLGNAVKYSVGAPRIHVAAKADGRFVTISIRDEGIGIPREDVEHVFDQFYRGRNVNKGGSGLGLTIVKRILEYHRGQIRLRSDVTFGTEVELLFPIATAS